MNDEPRAAEIAEQTMRQLWDATPAHSESRSVESWTAGLGNLFTRFSGGTGPLDARLVDIAENVRVELLPSAQACVLLYADLHHFNILYGNDPGWLAIDPKGVMGDRAYETAAFLLNRDPAIVLDRTLPEARATILANCLRMDAQRIVRWAFFQSVLSAWWTIEDSGEDWEASISAARLLVSILR